MQAVSHLLAWGGRFVCINYKNLEGKTALDILQEQPQDVDNSEMRAMRNALVVVAVPLVTVTYEAALSPHGGLWQDALLKPNTTTASCTQPS